MKPRPAELDEDFPDAYLMWNEALAGLLEGRYARRDAWACQREGESAPFLFLERGRFDFEAGYENAGGDALRPSLLHVQGMITDLFQQGSHLVLPKIWHQAGEIRTEWQPTAADVLAGDWRVLESPNQVTGLQRYNGDD